MNWCENVILLATVDSTNNYAMRLIDDDKAQAGLLVVAQLQQAGKGQRGRQWQDQPGESLLMSLLVQPQLPLSQQFIFSATVAVAVTGVVATLLPDARVAIKWPNDIIINDKKAGGILIENQLRGSQWLYAVVGLGLNVNQPALPGLPHATSLAMNGATVKDIPSLALRLREAIRQALSLANKPALLRHYNDQLYRKGQWQQFLTQEGKISARVEGVLPEGRLCLRLADGSQRQIWHGEWEWVW